MIQYTVDPELDRAIRAGVWHEGPPAKEPPSPWGTIKGTVLHMVKLP